MDVIYVRVCELTRGTQSLPPKSILFILPILSSVWIPETEFSDNYLYLSGAPRRESGQAPYHHPEGRSISTPHGHPRVHVCWRGERSAGSAPRK